MPAASAGPVHRLQHLAGAHQRSLDLSPKVTKLQDERGMESELPQNISNFKKRPSILRFQPDAIAKMSTGSVRSPSESSLIQSNVQGTVVAKQDPKTVKLCPQLAIHVSSTGRQLFVIAVGLGC